MRVIIGVDPHQATHTAVAISGLEERYELTREHDRAMKVHVQESVDLERTRRIVRSELGTMAGLIGAGLLAFDAV